MLDSAKNEDSGILRIRYKINLLIRVCEQKETTEAFSSLLKTNSIKEDN